MSLFYHIIDNNLSTLHINVMTNAGTLGLRTPPPPNNPFQYPPQSEYEM